MNPKDAAPIPTTTTVTQFDDVDCRWAMLLLARSLEEHGYRVAMSALRLDHATGQVVEVMVVTPPRPVALQTTN